jgi:gamma-glutamyl hydrolase
MAKKSWDQFRDPYPIWGTCLGFELLALFAVDGQRNLAPCSSQDQALALQLTDEWQESLLGQTIPQQIEAIATSKKVTINFHRWCLTPANFSSFHMEDFWRMLATGTDLNNLGN